MDQYTPRDLPTCQLALSWLVEGRRPTKLHYTIKLKGAESPGDFFGLVIDPQSAGIHTMQCSTYLEPVVY